MSKQNLTAARVESLPCELGKQQTIYWDAKTPGFGLRVTTAGARAYIFESRLFGKTIRLTIGDARAWDLGRARTEAARLKTLIDDGKDPREARAQQQAAHEARQAEARRRDVTFGEAWDEYVESRKPFWSERHYNDHLQHADEGGKPKKRGKGLTQAGPLAELRPLKLSELISERIAEWMVLQSQDRPTMSALSFRLLRGFIRWTHDSPSYKGIVPTDAYKARDVRDVVPRVKAKDGDSLQREQLGVWFREVRKIANPVQSAYLQGLLLTGARREEWAGLRWEDVDFRWRSVVLDDKVEGTGGRTIPLTPYLATLLMNLKRLNETPPDRRQLVRLAERGETWAPSEWVFASKTSEDGKIAEPRIAHNKALAAAELPHVTLHGLRRSFGTLSEWVEVPVGVVAQIQGHKPSAIAEKHYRRRPLDLLRSWHDKIESWMLEQAGVPFEVGAA
ncbi:Phage integrase [Burkholderia pseudomallei]|uniref:tyrosine-type recombinase/integrase n=1 Tax=Burkholderia pseudomallei TaxID=28450 RepID=UPI000F085935|nr:integrase family protein [Burkholderia pseudomallei]CAJ3196914.1 Phage integrase [Burkholderia pseudomallei]VCN52069.1 Phage integrase [Burkholderia pseudomallei]VCN59812.1 Phage integrase [Burkholderia pseudomallei]VCN64650.1 Phage integrase [Burkholderia pseudomallei]VCN71230.1 Phage integrase [Burkholderia pseudomallei]